MGHSCGVRVVGRYTIQLLQNQDSHITQSMLSRNHINFSETKQDKSQVSGRWLQKWICQFFKKIYLIKTASLIFKKVLLYLVVLWQIYNFYVLNISSQFWLYIFPICLLTGLDILYVSVSWCLGQLLSIAINSIFITRLYFSHITDTWEWS